MDTDIVEREILEVCDRMLAENPEVAEIQLECSDLPPFAAAVPGFLDCTRHPN